MNLLNLLIQNGPNLIGLLLVVLYLQNRIHRLEVNLREEISKVSQRVAKLEAHFEPEYKVAEEPAPFTE